MWRTRARAQIQRTPRGLSRGAFGRARADENQLPTLRALPVDVKVLLALLPRAGMAPMQTTMIRASITAYSTAGGPSSRCTKSTTNCPSFRMGFLLLCTEVNNRFWPGTAPEVGAFVLNQILPLIFSSLRPMGGMSN